LGGDFARLLSISLPNNEQVFDDKSGGERWQNDPFGQLSSRDDETFAAGGRIVFAGARHRFDELEHAEAPERATDPGRFPAGQMRLERAVACDGGGANTWTHFAPSKSRRQRAVLHDSVVYQFCRAERSD
jgi:hypothetical protein